MKWFTKSNTMVTLPTDSVWQGAKRILELLHRAGFEAYVVGGAVRDLLLHKQPHDYDIVTNAKPDETMAVVEQAGFTTSGLVGKSFGVVVAKVPEGAYEIATYRSERYGADSHRPEEVFYAKTLEEDVMRRDFTVNGMALTVDGVLIDYVGGAKDIKNKVLRTIGEAQERFSEDALRLFRACRFVGKLGFMAHESLIDGMAPSFGRVPGLSLERVKQEVENLLLTPYAAKGLDVLVRTHLNECNCSILKKGVRKEIAILPELSHLVDLPQQKEFHAFDGWIHTLAVVDATRSDLILRWAALLHDVGKGLPHIRGFHNNRITDRGHDREGAQIAIDLLTRWQYPKQFVERVSWLVENHMKFHYFANNEEADPWKWMRKEARSGHFRKQEQLKEAVLQMAEVCAADVVGCGKPHSSTDGTYAFGDCLAHISKEMPVHTRDLHYNSDLVNITKPHTGDILQALLMRVQNGQLPNEPQALYEAALHRLERIKKQLDSAESNISEDSQAMEHTRS
ncbi:CCA tRNA nucleotidyltransferase [uncultured Veillonella sp.]|uniref:CCA tRNA nucleotidyltransferase n=1 Tax=uncultured Veillonella sp. TaxID=159268 RepID=UPI00262CFBCE|nr:CCA tRNA nucleotidyltransferase [uncultured Veillonella sp.]